MTPLDMWALVAVAGCVLVAAVFAAAQRALGKVTLTQAKAAADSGHRGGRALVELMRDPVPAVTACALVVLAAQVTGVAVLTVVAGRHLAAGPTVAVTALVGVALLFVLADVAPKTWALSDPERTARLFAPWVRRVTLVLGPPVSLLMRLGRLLAGGRRRPGSPYVTEDELRAMIDAAESDEVIEAGERAMIHSIFELGDTVVREIMVPRPDMITVNAEAPVDRVLTAIIEHGYSRLPVWRDDRDRIVGLVYAKDVLAWMREGHDASEPWDPLLRTPFFVPELKRVDGLLRELQAQKVHLAIVVDEYGATTGLVTIEDILEEIVGEIVDEYDDEEPLVEQTEDGGLRIDGRLAVDDLDELVTSQLPDDEWDTVGGLLVGLLGRVPSVGEWVDVEGLRLTTEAVNGRRVAKVLVERLEPVEEGEPADETGEPDAAAADVALEPPEPETEPAEGARESGRTP